MSKDYVWDIIFFYHTDGPKFFLDFSKLENDQTVFHVFPHPVKTLRKVAVIFSHKPLDAFYCSYVVVSTTS